MAGKRTEAPDGLSTTGSCKARVADEFLADVMRAAVGIDCAEAATDVVVHDVDEASIPFASPRLLWRMKAVRQRHRMGLSDAPRHGLW